MRAEPCCWEPSKSFYAFYAPTLFSTALCVTLFPVYARKRRRLFAANFQQLIALKWFHQHRAPSLFFPPSKKKSHLAIRLSVSLPSPIWVLSAPLSILGCSCFLAPLPPSPCWCIDPISLRRQTAAPSPPLCSTAMSDYQAPQNRLHPQLKYRVVQGQSVAVISGCRVRMMIQ